MYKLIPVLFLFFSMLASGQQIKAADKIKPGDTLVQGITYSAYKNLDGRILTWNTFGNYELYVFGNPRELGYYTGSLTENLYHFQESSFFNAMKERIPSRFNQKLMMRFLKWYNRKLPTFFSQELTQELTALSRFSNPVYNNLVPPLKRAMYLHAAHDIGHALQDKIQVGCSSVALWGKQTPDQKLLIGRTFDFYISDAFAQNKLVQFVKPDCGYAFASVSWPGFIGVVSGMNTAGITVTLNAGNSDIPWSAKKPVSIVAREILQYASTLSEAIAIAKNQQVFVGESFLVGSGKERRAIVIEMTPDKQDVFEMTDAEYVICTNHFLGDSLKSTPKNSAHISNSHSTYRYQKIEEEIAHQTLDVSGLIGLLRDQSGVGNTDLGLGNEKALNQLMAHHSVVFEPEDLKMWVSSSPYQMGAFQCYDLNQIFNGVADRVAVNTSTDRVPSSSFVNSQAYVDYLQYTTISKELTTTDHKFTDAALRNYQSTNPELWKVYFITAQYYYKNSQYQAALQAVEVALLKELPSKRAADKIQNLRKQIIRKLK